MLIGVAVAVPVAGFFIVDAVVVIQQDFVMDQDISVTFLVVGAHPLLERVLQLVLGRVDTVGHHHDELQPSS